MMSSDTLTSSSIDIQSMIVSLYVELASVSMLLDRLSQLSIRVARHSEFVVTMSAQEYVHFEVEFEVNHMYVLTEKDILNIISASKVHEIIEDELQISEVLISNVSFSQAHEALTILSTFGCKHGKVDDS